MKANQKHRTLTRLELKAQGARCKCEGKDNMCECQLTPDKVTLKAWGMTWEQWACPAAFDCNE